MSLIKTAGEIRKDVDDEVPICEKCNVELDYESEDGKIFCPYCGHRGQSNFTTKEKYIIHDKFVDEYTTIVPQIIKGVTGKNNTKEWDEGFIAGIKALEDELDELLLRNRQ
jgi:uncharacterized Zn finger protein (UPF0148 family)